MIVMSANVTDACYLLVHVEPDATVDIDDPLAKMQYDLIAIDTTNGGKAETVRVIGESFAMLVFSVLVSYEEMFESGIELEDTGTHIGRAYEFLKNSDLTEFLPLTSDEIPL
jgi:hypothetical protein